MSRVGTRVDTKAEIDELCGLVGEVEFDMMESVRLSNGYVVIMVGLCTNFYIKRI